jgi:hypothetical protein
MWFERYNFKEDPYIIRDPFTIPLDMILWDRDDLPQKGNLLRFIGDVVHGYRVGLKVYGPAGSGKTWLLRYLEKTLLEKLGDEVAVVYGKIFRGDPTFSVLYDTVVRDWNQRHREKVLDAVEGKADRDRVKWREYIGDSDLATCLHEIRYRSEEQKARICEHWLRGARVGARELADVGIMSSLDSDYRRYLALRKLLELTLLAYETCVLIVDELENAPPRLAQALGDFLRDLLDSYSERFALACSYTAQAADELLDWGYGEFLFTRLEYDVRLDPITPDSASDIFRVHHGAYRKKLYTDDELLPFTESGLRRLINSMDPLRWYPRHILVNCSVLGRIASEENVDAIDEDFVDRQASQRPERFQYLTSKPRLI